MSARQPGSKFTVLALVGVAMAISSAVMIVCFTKFFFHMSIAAFVAFSVIYLLVCIAPVLDEERERIKRRLSDLSSAPGGTT